MRKSRMLIGPASIIYLVVERLEKRKIILHKLQITRFSKYIVENMLKRPHESGEQMISFDLRAQLTTDPLIPL